jgi:hypothetical protein
VEDQREATCESRRFMGTLGREKGRRDGRLLEEIRCSVQSSEQFSLTWNLPALTVRHRQSVSGS